MVGEAVALHLRLAKLPSRALALALDLVLLGGVLLLVGGVVDSVAAGADAALEAALVLGTLVLVVIGWPVAWETLSRGRTPGKMALGLRVVRDDGGPIRFRHAFTRALAAVFVDFFPPLLGSVGVIVSLCSSKGKRVGDLMAGTVVVRERIPRTAAPPAPVPPALAHWAAELPVTRLTDAVALQARQVLTRRQEFDPVQAQYWANRLADEVLAELGAARPHGADPVLVLAAVLDERRNRELARAGWTPAWPGGPMPGWGAPPPAPWPNAAQGWSAPPQPAPVGPYGGYPVPPAYPPPPAAAPGYPPPVPPAPAQPPPPDAPFQAPH